MAKINNVELKGTKNTCGREGYGFMANVYLNNKKVGDVADYGNGSCTLNINITKESEEAIKKIAQAYYTKNPKWGVKVDSRYILDDFFNELHELKENETMYKKNVKKGFDKMLILSYAKREEEPLKDDRYVIEDLAMSCKFEGDKPSKAYIDRLNRDYPNNTHILAQYNRLEDFNID